MQDGACNVEQHNAGYIAHDGDQEVCNIGELHDGDHKVCDIGEDNDGDQKICDIVARQAGSDHTASRDGGACVCINRGS